MATKLLVADRGNDRLLLLDDTGKTSGPTHRRPLLLLPEGFYFPDDAFFIRHGTAILSNQEDNDTLVEIGLPFRSNRFLLRSPPNARVGAWLPQHPR